MESNISKVLRAASKDDNQYKQAMKHISTHMHNKMKEKAAKDMEKRRNSVKINEDTLRKIIAESVKKVLKENMEDGPSFAEDNLVRKIVEYHLKDFKGKYSDSDIPVWQLLRDFGHAVGNNILALCKNGGIDGIDNDPELGG